LTDLLSRTARGMFRTMMTAAPLGRYSGSGQSALLVHARERGVSGDAMMEVAEFAIFDDPDGKITSTCL